jgi:hypothetical protein
VLLVVDGFMHPKIYFMYRYVPYGTCLLVPTRYVLDQQILHR